MIPNFACKIRCLKFAKIKKLTRAKNNYVLTPAHWTSATEWSFDRVTDATRQHVVLEPAKHVRESESLTDDGFIIRVVSRVIADVDNRCARLV